MSPQPFHARRPVLGAKDAHRLNDARREASRLRSRRAARLAVEQAGVRRRAVLAGVLGVAVAVLVVLPLMGVIGWAWVAIPSVLLVAVLGYSRAVASHSAKLRSEEESRMQELREVIAQLGSGASSRTIDEDAHGAGSASGAGAVRGAPADLSAVVEDAEASSDGAAGAEESADAGEAVISDAHDREEAVGEAPGDSGEVAADADSTEGAEAVHQSSPDAARRSGSRQWSVRRTPAPSYQAKPRVAGRQVHADTDIKGVPVVDPTRVPARPVDTSLFSGQSTAQVAASQPVSFDLDQVLDNRRAQ